MLGLQGWLSLKRTVCECHLHSLRGKLISLQEVKEHYPVGALDNGANTRAVRRSDSVLISLVKAKLGLHKAP